MTRDETVALFLECEAKRAEARAAAQAGGKSENEASDIAHEAAKAHWNAWADTLNAGRKALEASGAWAVEKNWFGSLEPKNAETHAWMDKAETNFSRCLFLVKGADKKEAAGEDKEKLEAGATPVKSIVIDSALLDMRGFVFPGAASFDSAAFSGYASFDSAAFSGAASFDSAAFSGGARFDRAAFSGAASFDDAAFSGGASFDGAAFSGGASFDGAAFSGVAWFDSAAFSGGASFDSAAFSGAAWFNSAVFKQNVSFGLARFDRSASFNEAKFEGPASFEAIRGERGFSMADAVFDAAPDFIQAHFEEAPRLDNLQVEGRWRARHPHPEREEAETLLQRVWRALAYAGGRARTSPGRASMGAWRRLTEEDRRNIPARWRALKRLAIQGEDTDRELEFHAREIEAERFADDWPLPFAFWRGAAWAGSFRFWFGFFYGFASNFGRSLARPFLFWLLAVIAGAVFYAGQSPDMIAPRAKMEGKGASQVPAAFATAWHAWRLHPKPCYAGEPLPPKNANGDTPPYIGALTPGLASGTDLANEAWHLAVRNAFIVLDGSSEAAHRSFGCLYGVEMYGGSNPLAVVPSAVSSVSAIQKLFSALMIFLFGLALRNMLKVK